jgi:hypothetical protein
MTFDNKETLQGFSFIFIFAKEKLKIKGRIALFLR